MNDIAAFLRATYEGRFRSSPDDHVQVTAKIDDEAPSDWGLCQIHVTTTGTSTFNLQINKCPMTDDLREFVGSHDGTIDETRIGTTIKLELSIKQVGVIRNLAKIIRRTVGRGRRYLDPSWKWICRRTADSLDRFATTLMEFRRSPQPTTPLGKPAAGPQTNPSGRQTQAHPSGAGATDDDLFAMTGTE